MDYIIEMERFGDYNKEAIKRLVGIQKMTPENKSYVFALTDGFIVCGQ